MEVCIEIAPEEEDTVPITIKRMMEDVSDVIPYVPVVSDVECTSTTWADKKDVYL